MNIKDFLLYSYHPHYANAFIAEHRFMTVRHAADDNIKAKDLWSRKYRKEEFVDVDIYSRKSKKRATITFYGQGQQDFLVSLNKLSFRGLKISDDPFIKDVMIIGLSPNDFQSEGVAEHVEIMSNADNGEKIIRNVMQIFIKKGRLLTPGNSGAAILNPKEEVVGIICAGKPREYAVGEYIIKGFEEPRLTFTPDKRLLLAN